MKRLVAPVFLLALMAALLPGCTSTSQLIAVGLRIELTGITQAGDGSVSASWHVANSNVVAYLLTRVTHKVYLNGTYLGMVVDEEPLAVPANSNAGRSSKLTGGNAAATRVVAAAAANGSGSYRVDTQIIIRIYGDTIEKSALANTGTVPVVAK
jgi:hypothetical protein